MAKKISKKQLLANRRNAKKATGPKTKLGKLMASKNAILILRQITIYF